MKFAPACHLFAVLVSALPAAPLAPASAQYDTNGQVAAAPPPSPVAPMSPSAEKRFSRKIWPEVELSDGRVFKNVRVSAEDAATVTLIHSDGVAKVDKRALPDEMADQYHYDSAAAKAEAAETRSRLREEQMQSAPQAAAPRRIIRPTPPPAPVVIAETPSSAQSGADTAQIKAAARERARRYFESEKRNGSGQTLVFGLRTTIEAPVAVAGWPNRWEMKGVASYRYYDSVWGGSFSSRTQNFRVTVEMASGQEPEVVDFSPR